jgi:hypothetical protein
MWCNIPLCIYISAYHVNCGHKTVLNFLFVCAINCLITYMYKQAWIVYPIRILMNFLFFFHWDSECDLSWLFCVLKTLPGLITPKAKSISDYADADLFNCICIEWLINKGLCKRLSFTIRKMLNLKKRWFINQIF